MMRFVCLFAVMLLGDAMSLRSAGDSAFMLVSGVTSKTEMCLSVENSNIALDSCAAAIGAGDGRELWSLSSGSLSSLSSKSCLGVSDGTVGLTSCDGASKVEPQSNGQLKVDGQCLSFSGGAPGKANVAANAAASASSSNSVAHGAAAAVDENDASFWASKFDEAGAVTLSIGLADQALSEATIAWEFPAKAFSVSVSADGEHYSNVYSTDSNVLSTTTVPLGGARGTSLKITMTEAGASFQGHSVYGIRSVSVSAPQLTAVVGDCGAATGDARDKVFLSHVAQFDPQPAKALLAELPSLEAAKASLSATVSELQDVLPKLAACKAKTGLAETLLAQTKLYQASAHASGVVDAGSVDALLKAARAAILAARSALA